MVTMCSRGVSGRRIGQSGKSTLSRLRVPSPSTLSKYRRPRSAVVPVQGRAVDVVDYCAHKQVRYRRQINLNRSFAGCRRDASKGTRAMSLRKDGQGTKTTSPAALA